MPLRFILLLPTAIPVLLFAGESAAQQISLPLLGQTSSAEYASANPGGYLSWVHLLLVVVAFIFWVKFVDWVNRDAMKIGELTEMPPEVWNPINLGAFFVGFLVVLFLPIFFVGYPIFLLAAFVPPLVYFFMRRSAIKSEPRILERVAAKAGQTVDVPLLPQDEGAEVKFTPAGDKQQQQVNLIRARQSSGFPTLKDMIADALTKRADIILLDYTRDRVNARLQVDGAWHALPAMNREVGDAVLVSIKNLAGVNPTERRAKQTGQFAIKTEDDKADIELLTQGVPTGERAQLKVKKISKVVLTLSQLGMFPEMVERLKTSLNKPGLAIISAPSGQGLTSSWRGTLVTADRLTRDCVAVIDQDETESVVENYVLHRYDTKSGKRQLDAAKAMILSQPDLIVAPEVEDAETMDLLTSQVINQERSVLLRSQAKSAAEALLKVYSKCGDRDSFVNAARHVTCQRLLRRLCDECKQEVRVTPKMIQQLGGDPRKQQTMFNQYRLPPPEQRVDEKGNPIEIPPCEFCGGLGFVGRIAVFEMIEVDDKIRNALRQNPKVGVIEKTAQQAGKKSLVNQAYHLVLMGVTSLAEVQRVFKE